MFFLAFTKVIMKMAWEVKSCIVIALSWLLLADCEYLYLPVLMEAVRWICIIDVKALEQLIASLLNG